LPPLDLALRSGGGGAGQGGSSGVLLPLQCRCVAPRTLGLPSLHMAWPSQRVHPVPTPPPLQLPSLHYSRAGAHKPPAGSGADSTPRCASLPCLQPTPWEAEMMMHVDAWHAPPHAAAKRPQQTVPVHQDLLRPDFPRPGAGAQRTRWTNQQGADVRTVARWTHAACQAKKQSKMKAQQTV
jgi:hypothetical protein